MKVAGAIGLLLVSTAPAAGHASLATGPHGNPAAWFGPDSYPPAAMRREAQGRTVAQLAIDAAGKVTGCTVAISSGDVDLDAGTCRTALARGRFAPAIDTLGRPIASSYRLPVRWVLPTDTAAGAPAPAVQQPRQPGQRGWFARYYEAHHLIGFATLLLALLAAQVRRLFGWSRFAEDGRELWGDQPFVAPSARPRRFGLDGRVFRVAMTVGPVIALAIAIAWFGW